MALPKKVSETRRLRWLRNRTSYGKETCVMASREPPRRRMSFRYESNGGGCGWMFWLSTGLAVLGIVLTVAFGIGWL